MLWKTISGFDCKFCLEKKNRAEDRRGNREFLKSEFFQRNVSNKIIFLTLNYSHFPHLDTLAYTKTQKREGKVK